MSSRNGDSRPTKRSAGSVPKTPTLDSNSKPMPQEQPYPRYFIWAPTYEDPCNLEYFHLEFRQPDLPPYRHRPDQTAIPPALGGYIWTIPEVLEGDEWLEVPEALFRLALSEETWAGRTEVDLRTVPAIASYIQSLPKPKPPPTNHRIGVPKGRLP